MRSIASTGLDLIGFGDLGAPALKQLAHFDSIHSWYGTTREDFRDAVAHLPFTFYSALPSGEIHAADFYLSQVGSPLGAVPQIPVERKPGGFIAIHPFSSSPRKNWSLEKFVALASILPKPVQFCAGPEEKLANAIRKNDLGELARWLASADLYIGNDSGISHLAAAVGTPTLVIFCATNPIVWAPRGRHVRILEGEPSIEHVAATATSLLETDFGQDRS